MTSLRFDGQVAIVTGAGSNPGLGRSHARLLAAAGAKVVVNDLGVGPDGRGDRPSRAEAVVREIRDAGGEAVADANSVATEEGARAIVQTALDAYGRVDILINNAGVIEFALFEELSALDIDKMIGVHLMGAIWMCRAVWPHMKAQRYGRIINTTSGSVIGAKYATVYGAAKAGVFGLTRNLAIEGAEHGVKVNSYLPNAATVAWSTLSADEGQPSEEIMKQFSPDLAAPAASFLAHADCPFTGKCIGAGAQNIYELWLARTQGDDQAEWSPALVGDKLDRILDRQDYREYGDPWDGCADFTLQPRDYKPQ